jgi:hypothetical protein
MEARLHTLSRLVALVLLGTTLASPAWSCGVPDTAPLQDQDLQDLNWVRAPANLFIAFPQGSTFHLQLGPYSRTVVGEDAEQSISPINLSPDKRWLLYRLGGGPEYRLYDIQQRQIHRLDMPLQRFSTFAFSPDSRFLAAPIRNGSDHGIAVLDLKTRSSREFIPTGETKPNGMAGLIAWSNDSRNVLIDYATRIDAPTAFAFDPASGIFRVIDSVRDNGRSIEGKTRYFENGQEIGAGCVFCSLIPPTEIGLVDGAKVIHHDHRIEVIRPGRPPILLAETPKPPPRKPDEPALACAGPAFHLLGAFGGQYVLYRADGLAWIYGLAENRKALLTGSTLPVQILW